MAGRKNPHIGSSIESFLVKEGIFESATRKAVRAVVAWQTAMDEKRRNVKRRAKALKS
jgi:hypothetical protein